MTCAICGMNIRDRVKLILNAHAEVKLKTTGESIWIEPLSPFQLIGIPLIHNIIAITHNEWVNSCRIITNFFIGGRSHFRFEKMENVKPKCEVCGKKPHKDGEVCPKLRFEHASKP